MDTESVGRSPTEEDTEVMKQILYDWDIMDKLDTLKRYNHIGRHL
jgi:hypothetical protein